jgi:hypothetical protein
MFRSRPGALPSDGNAEVGGIALPSGRRVIAEDGTAVAWITDEPGSAEAVGDVMRRLVDAFPVTGLWPLYSPTSLGYAGLDDLDGPTPVTADISEVMRDLDAWVHAPEDEDEDEDDDDPVPRLPGLADLVPGPEPTAAGLPVDVAGRLALVPVTRPADVPAALGWGAPNYDFTGDRISVVLRSWEDRFGATLVGLEGDTMYVYPGRLPADPAQLARLAGEHYAFCADTIDQGIPWSDYLVEMPRQVVWTFWWD